MVRLTVARAWTFAVLFAATQSALASGAPRTHDGLFTKVALFAGPAWHDYDADLNTGVRHEGAATSFGLGVGVMVGGTPAPGWVLGGTFLALGQREPEFENPRVARGWETVRLETAVLGAFTQFYPDPKGGLHFAALAGYAAQTLRLRRPNADSPLACPVIFPSCFERALRKEELTSRFGGAAFGLGAGYDFWIGKQWSFGATANVLYAVTRARSSRFGDGMHYALFTPTLIAGVTYH